MLRSSGTIHGYQGEKELSSSCKHTKRLGVEGSLTVLMFPPYQAVQVTVKLRKRGQATMLMTMILNLERKKTLPKSLPKNNKVKSGNEKSKREGWKT